MHAAMPGAGQLAYARGSVHRLRLPARTLLINSRTLASSESPLSPSPMHAAATDAQSAALRTLLRSLGQIVLQPNAFTGACLLAAWLLAIPRLACAALMGAVAANVSAILIDARPPEPDDETRAGLHGFNGALAGLAAFNFIADNATAAAVAIFAATGYCMASQPWFRAGFAARGLGFFSSPV